MKKISNKELEKITGGELSVWVYVVTAAIVTFVSGIIDGYTHPKSCRSSS